MKTHISYYNLCMFSSSIEVMVQKGVKIDIIKRIRTDLDEAVKRRDKKEVERLQRILRQIVN